ncbi:hypothetical protein V6N11_040817 [Hibiscus sabdariffa]|uniref:Uncharacterized protein n=1 Tax=Hibiscus sabdariffa TaxID=183260 RepID=A0ABR2RIS6_9ROSI
MKNPQKLCRRKLDLLTCARVPFLVLRQKSRIQYIREDDQNSSFFVRQVAARQKFNMITMLKDSQGHKLESFEAISNVLVNHFVGSLGTIDENVEVVQDNLLKEGLIKTLLQLMFQCIEIADCASAVYLGAFLRAATAFLGAITTALLPILFNNDAVTVLPS